MFIIIFLVCLCSNVLLVKSEDNGNITIQLKTGENCTALLPSYRITEGHNVTLVLNTDFFINYGWWRLVGSSGTKDLASNLTKTYTRRVDKSEAGIWEFEFLNHQNTYNFKNIAVLRKSYNGNNYTRSICRTNVTIVPSGELDIQNSNKYVIIGSLVGVIAVIIILAQTACIVYLKAKAKRLNRHNNLSKKMEQPVTGDRDRYCSNPRQKKLKVAPLDEINSDRESIIYEAPNIELPDRLPVQPPQPPAIHTIPRTPRSEHNIRIGPPAMLAASLNSPSRNDNHPTFPRPKQERDINIGNRAPLPLPYPPHDDRFEVYEEMDTEENTYEPPPKVMSTMPPRHPIPQKKPLPSPKMMPVQREQLKLRCANRPPITPKPQRPRSNNMTPTNELEQAFNRRNNVMQVPIVSIPDPSTSRGPSPRPRPPPAVQSKPRGPPVPQPVQEEIYYNEKQDSSDEEWTYEPLKPLNSYDKNIYNV